MEINQAIAKNLTAIRTSQGISISKLAKATGLSKAAISQIEQGEGNPTISTLSKLASALRVPYSAILDPTDHEPAAICLDDVPLMVSPDGSTRTRTYYSFAPDRSFEVLMLEFEPESSQTLSAMRDATRYIIVTSGMLVAEIGEFSYFLTSGDTINFDAADPCVLKNEDPVGAEAICVNAAK